MTDYNPEYLRASVCILDVSRGRLTGASVGPEVNVQIADDVFVWVDKAQVSRLIFG